MFIIKKDLKHPTTVTPLSEELKEGDTVLNAVNYAARDDGQLSERFGLT